MAAAGKLTNCPEVLSALSAMLKLVPCMAVGLALARVLAAVGPTTVCAPVCPRPPKRTPKVRPKLSLACTMRASIITWRSGTSILAIISLTWSRRAGMSVTNSWLVRGSAMTLPRTLRMREACMVALLSPTLFEALAPYPEPLAVPHAPNVDAMGATPMP